MACNGPQFLASATLRRQSSTVPRRKLKMESVVRRGSRLPFSVFSFAPKTLYNPFVILLDCEQRLLKQPIMRVSKFVSQTIQDGLLRSLLMLFTKRKSKKDPLRSQHTVRGQRRCRAEAKRCWDRARKLEKNMDLKGAIEEARRACELQPGNSLYLAMLSKQYTDMSFFPGVCDEDAREYNLKALEVSDRILELDPKNAIGHIAQAVCKGRLAYFSSNKRKIELAREAEECTKRAISCDEECDIGQHLMGRFHYEMAGLNVLQRTFVRVVYGQRLSPGSYQEALEYFSRAEAINPKRFIHKILLGKTYYKLGRYDLAHEAIQEAFKLDLADINDHLESLDAKVLLESLDKKTATKHPHSP